MRLVFTGCLFSFVFGQAAFAVMDAPPPEDTVRDAKTGALYWVFDYEVSEIREDLSGKPPDTSERGFGFRAEVTYRIERRYTSSSEKKKESGKPPSCPEGWQKQNQECILSAPLSPPLVFVLDTGENRERVISKAERNSALRRFNHFHSFFARGSDYLHGARSVDDFVYLDKAGKPHEVTFKREYDPDRGRFVSWLFYPVYEETCDSGWTRWNNYWRKEFRHTDCAVDAFNSTGWKEAFYFHKTAPAQGTTSFGWKSLNDSGEDCEKDLSELPKERKDRCYYAIPDPPLFTSKKGKPPKKPGKVRQSPFANKILHQ